MRVLVVNQDPKLSLVLTSALVGEADIQMLEVRTPQRALQQLDDVGGFDLVLADADTAPTGGFALAREVKARLKMGKDVPPVILLLARDQDRYLAKWSEADAFILKPADPFNLHAVITAVVAGQDVPDLPGVGSTADVPDALGVPEGVQGASPRSAGY
jgi:DNA-binding response OmpR family regulator